MMRPNADTSGRQRAVIGSARYGAIASLESARRFLDDITRAAGPEGVEGQQEALVAIRVAINALAVPEARS